MCILTRVLLQTNLVLKSVEELLLATTVRFVAERVDFSTISNVENEVTPKQFVVTTRDSISPWKYPACLQYSALDYPLDTLSSLPFAVV